VTKRFVVASAALAAGVALAYGQAGGPGITLTPVEPVNGHQFSASLVNIDSTSRLWTYNVDFPGFCTTTTYSLGGGTTAGLNAAVPGIYSVTCKYVPMGKGPPAPPLAPRTVTTSTTIGAASIVKPVSGTNVSTPVDVAVLVQSTVYESANHPCGPFIIGIIQENLVNQVDVDGKPRQDTGWGTDVPNTNFFLGSNVAPATLSDWIYYAAGGDWDFIDDGETLFSYDQQLRINWSMACADTSTEKLTKRLNTLHWKIIKVDSKSFKVTAQ
jgi:hypothetical protein